MYKITVILENPMIGDTESIVRQFNQDTMTQAKWSAAWPIILERLNILKARSTDETNTNKEPEIW